MPGKKLAIAAPCTFSAVQKFKRRNIFDRNCKHQMSK
jgi:hypothetical protein